jgi:hypothetical protein
LSNLNITCEINFPKEGLGRGVSGLFVHDNKGNIYITHSGNLHVGKKGVGRESFRKFVQLDQFVNITKEDGKESPNILIGRLDDSELPYKVASFVKSANSFKERDDSRKRPQVIAPSIKEFSPEFYGQRKSYCLTDIITSQCNHGIVVNTLKNIIENKGLNLGSDRRDLYIYDEGLVTTIFEAKTDLSTSSIYSAIGQLMYHSVFYDPVPQLVMVLPSEPKEGTKEILNRLGIEILRYKLEKDNVRFFGLDELLKR